MQRLRLAAVATVALAALSACNEEAPDIEALATGDRTVPDYAGSTYDLRYALALDGCNATITRGEVTSDGVTKTWVTTVDMATVDAAQMDDGVDFEGSLGFLRMFSAEGAPEFTVSLSEEGPLADESRSWFLENGGTCEENVCRTTYTRPHLQMWIGGPNPFENTDIVTEALTTLAQTCAATE